MILFSKEKSSRTAYYAAWFRACAHMDFQDQRWGPDFLAGCFLSFPTRLLIRSNKYRALGKAKTNASTPGIYEYIIARTLFFDEVFKQAMEESITQIVFLGAGYDSRGIRFKPHNSSNRIIELDMAATQNRKIKCLRKNRIKIPDYLRFVAIDFNNQSLESVLASAGYQTGKPTLFIWEGVCMYLEPRSVRDTLSFIQQSSGAGSLLAFDCVVSFPGKAAHKYHGAAEMLQYMGDKHKNEPFRYSMEVGNLADFLSGCGHRIVRHMDQDQIESTYLKRPDGSSIGRQNGLFNMIITSPEV